MRSFRPYQVILDLSTGQKLQKLVHFHIKYIFATESVSPYQFCTHAYQGPYTPAV